MKKFLSLLLMIATNFVALAQTSIAGVAFGSDYNETIKILKEKFGEPESEEKDQVGFVDKNYGGIQFNLIIFGFQYGGGKSYFNRCVFVKTFKTASEAKDFRELFAQKLGRDYSLNEYISDNKFKGYEGGVDPTDDDSCGFYLDVKSPTPELHFYGVRLYYGPYNYVNENF